MSGDYAAAHHDNETADYSGDIDINHIGGDNRPDYFRAVIDAADRHYEYDIVDDDYDGDTVNLVIDSSGHFHIGGTVDDHLKHDDHDDGAAGSGRLPERG